MAHIVAKFGGSSLATEEGFLTVRDIMRADPNRTYAVVSAPGRSSAHTTKVTDELIAALVPGKRAFLARTAHRFLRLMLELDVAKTLWTEVGAEFARWSDENRFPSSSEQVRANILALGEWTSARILAELLAWPFVDARHLIRFNSNALTGDTLDLLATQEAFLGIPSQAVIPGFYGRNQSGHTVLFPRNGSDVSGAVVARMTKAARYENWTDTTGVLSGDPRIVPNARLIPSLTRTELQELAYRGTSVLHGDALYPLVGTSIQVHVRNTFQPSQEGTYVVELVSELRGARDSVVGIAGRTNFTILELRKVGMNQMHGFLARLCEAFADEEVSIELMPGGINVQSVIVADEELDNKEDALVRRIRESCAPDTISIERTSLALLCVVGETMAHHHGVLARAARALADHSINVRIVDQGASESSIIFGVASADYERGLRALHDAFFPS